MFHSNQKVFCFIHKAICFVLKAFCSVQTVQIISGKVFSPKCLEVFGSFHCVIEFSLSFCSVPKTFCSIPKAFHSFMHKVFHFVQTDQRSHGLLVSFRVFRRRCQSFHNHLEHPNTYSSQYLTT